MRESVIFRSATLVALLHGLDDAFVSRQPGVALGEHAVAAAVAVVAAVAAIATFDRLRPGWRAALALTFGVLAVANGALHAIHVTVDGPSSGDFTGLLAVGAGAVLLVLGASIPIRHPARPRRWRNRTIAGLGGLVAVYALVMPVAAAIVQTHKVARAGGRSAQRRVPIGEVQLRRRARAGRLVRAVANRAAVVLVHGGGSDRRGARAHARLLARHGYGVLLYDSRGRGESEGNPNAYGLGLGEGRGRRAGLPARAPRGRSRPHRRPRPLDGRRRPHRGRGGAQGPQGGRLRRRDRPLDGRHRARARTLSSSGRCSPPSPRSPDRRPARRSSSSPPASPPRRCC
jgi:hypothetical protein